MNTILIKGPSGGFSPGITSLATIDNPTGIAISLLRLAQSEEHAFNAPSETALLLLYGEVEVTLGAQILSAGRESPFDDLPLTLHLPAQREAHIRAETEATLLVYQTSNTSPFSPTLLGPTDYATYKHDADIVSGAASSLHRPLLSSGAEPSSSLLLAETINLPGRWSAYPPRHQPQPLAAFYLFSDPRGFGHTDIGDTVYKIFPRDTLLIPGGGDYTHCSAPGYAMYYAYALCQQPSLPYQGAELSPAHSWLLDPNAPIWQPEALSLPLYESRSRKRQPELLAPLRSGW